MTDQPMAAYKVYISSTYQDLKLHRQAVIAVLLKNTALFEPHAMEGYVAESITPVEKCLADVSTCNLYILILGNRYGYIPNDPVRNPDGLSITHLEYQTAYARQQQGQCKLFCFQAVDTTSVFPADADDPDGEKQAKLAQFKQHVGENFVCGEPFRYDYELRIAVQDALMNHIGQQLKPVGSNLHDVTKYCCDRSMHLIKFQRQNRTPRPFTAYEIRGRETDLGHNFIKRLGWEFLQWQQVKLMPSFASGELFTSTNYDAMKLDVLGILYLKLFGNYAPDDVSMESILQQWKRPYLLVTFMLDEQVGVVDAARWDLLMRLCQDVEQSLANCTTTQVYFFIRLDSNKPEPIATTHQPRAYYRLDLSTITYRDIEQWFYTFIHEDQSLFLRVGKRFFTQSSELPSLTMDVAETEIGKLVAACNKSPEPLLDYLQSL